MGVWRLSMNNLAPIEILLDNSVMSYGIVAHGIRVPVEGMVNRLFLIQAKPARSKNESWLREQIEALPTVARLAREKTINLHIYSELRNEAWRRPGSFPSSPFGDVFSDVDIAEAEPAAERSVFFQQDWTTYSKSASFSEFCVWLVNDYSDEWLSAPYIQKVIKPGHIKNLQEIGRYREICKSLPPKHYTDAFHLWTGEVNGLTHFMTVDQKFIKAIMNARNFTPRCMPVLPTDLLSQLGIAKRDALPFEYGARYLLSGRRYD
jgi:hypothetical protein